MAAVLSILVFDPDAAEGEGDVFSMHLRPALPCADTIATAAHLAVVAHNLTRTGPPLLPLPDGNVQSVFEPAASNYTFSPPPPPDGDDKETLAPAGGRGRGKR